MSAPTNVNTLLSTILKTNGISVLDFTGQTHAIPMQYPLYGRSWNPIGIVMHNTSGLIDLHNLVSTWAGKASPPPSHLAIDRSGTVAYFVRLDYADRATEHTNKHISIEFQAEENGGITDDQIKSAAVIYGFLHDVYGMEYAISTSRDGKGLAHHSLFVDASNPEGHANCPGGAIIGRKTEIIELAKTLGQSMDFGDDPTGVWRVRVDRWMWMYQFKPDNTVTWRDPFNNEKGSGTWKRDGKKLTLKWAGSKTVETWDFTGSSTAPTGNCQMEGYPNYPLTAVRETS